MLVIFLEFNLITKKEYDDRTINPENVNIFLEMILKGEVNENNAKDMFLHYIKDDYNYILKRGK